MMLWRCWVVGCAMVFSASALAEALPEALLQPSEIEDRAELIRLTTVQLSPSGVGLGDDSQAEADDELPVAEQREDALRVLVEEYPGIRLLVWVPRVDFERRLSARTRLALSQDLALPEAERGVELAGGLEVDIVEATEAATMIQFENRSRELRVAGWVPSSALSEVYRYDWLAEGRSTSHDIELLHTVTLRDTPEGEALAVLGHKGWYSLHEVGRVEGYVEIEMVSPEARVRGFVPEGAVRESWGGGGGSMCGGVSSLSGMGKSSSSIQIPSDTPLYDLQSGEVVGLTTRAFYTTAYQRTPYGVRLEISTRWGKVSLLARLRE